MALYPNSPQAILPRFPAGSELTNQQDVNNLIEQYITNNNIVSGGNIVVGAGSPEGIVVGNTNPPTLYWDNVGLILYVKNADDGLNTGWQAH